MGSDETACEGRRGSVLRWARHVRGRLVLLLHEKLEETPRHHLSLIYATKTQGAYKQKIYLST